MYCVSTLFLFFNFFLLRSCLIEILLSCTPLHVLCLQYLPLSFHFFLYFFFTLLHSSWPPLLLSSSFTLYFYAFNFRQSRPIPQLILHRSCTITIYICRRVFSTVTQPAMLWLLCAPSPNSPSTVSSDSNSYTVSVSPVFLTRYLHPRYPLTLTLTRYLCLLLLHWKNISYQNDAEYFWCWIRWRQSIWDVTGVIYFVEW